MANQEHLEMLKQGVEVWNRWREEHPDILPNLRGTDLREVDLREVDLTMADLIDVNFSGADLRKAQLKRALLWDADLRGANLSEASCPTATIKTARLSNANLYKAYLMEANFWAADLREADLRETYLYDAVLSEADLTRADLSGADLSYALFREANLREANLSHADLFQTAFIETYLFQADFSGAKSAFNVFEDVDLSGVKGLETLVHRGRSSIGISAIYRSQGNIPEVFLKGAGIDDTFITYIRSLVGKAIEYYSCFISYSSNDEAFARRLYADLQSNNIRCWFAPEDLKIGDKFWHRIDESIRIYDKLLVVLSEHSVQSDWVEREVMTALEKEKQGKIVLFPITLDDAVKDCIAPWAADLRRQRHIGDFRGWKNHDDYQKAFARLLRDLKASS